MNEIVYVSYIAAIRDTVRFIRESGKERNASAIVSALESLAAQTEVDARTKAHEVAKEWARHGATAEKAREIYKNSYRDTMKFLLGHELEENTLDPRSS